MSDYTNVQTVYMGLCECGQLSHDEHTGLCPTCKAAQYGGGETHERVRLFEPAPNVIAGQQGMDV